MKILFIYCEDVKNDIYKANDKKPLYSNDQIPFGIAYLVSSLRKDGHEISLAVLTKKNLLSGAEEAIRMHQPKVICFSIVSREFCNYVKISDLVKRKYPEILTVAGGPHVSLHPDEVLQSSIDILCLGEGEEALRELMYSIEHKKEYIHIDNIYTVKDGVTYKNKVRPFNCELDNLPIPDRSLWQPFIQNNKTPISILLGRGCHFVCSYCCNHALRKVAEGKYVRYRSPENIFAEIEYIVHNFPENDSIYFETEAMNCDKEFLYEFCSKLIEFNKSLPRTIFYGTNVRITPNEEWEKIFKLFRKANISYVNIGLESGSERVRKEIMRRVYSNDDVLEAHKFARKNRIYTMLYVMIGLPTETKEEYEMSVEMVRKCKPTKIHMGIFYPYPGTDLYKYCEEKGLLDTLKSDVGRNVASLDMPQFSRAKIQKEYNLFYPRMYAHSRFELYYFYILITLGERFGIKFFNQIVMKKVGHREVADPYVY